MSLFTQKQLKVFSGGDSGGSLVAFKDFVIYLLSEDGYILGGIDPNLD